MDGIAAAKKKKNHKHKCIKNMQITFFTAWRDLNRGDLVNCERHWSANE